MIMITRPFFLRQPIDVVIIPLDRAPEDGYCRIVGDDYFEDEDEINDDELGRFENINEALYWLEQNKYAPLHPGQQDGVFRSLTAVELFSSYFKAKAVVIIKKPRIAVPLTPVELAVIGMIGA